MRALEYGLERLQTLPMSLRLMRELHALLMEDVRGERQNPGAFRTRQNWIGAPGCAWRDASYVPPPVGEMQEALDALEQFLHAETSLPPLVRLALIHYQFEAIHPFIDGNGRIGRLLISLLSCAWDLLPRPLLYLSAYLYAHRNRYYDLLLAVSREGAWEAWLVFFLRGVAGQSRDAIARIRRLEDLRAAYREQVQTARTSAKLLQVVNLVFARPVLTVRQVEESLKVAYNTAQQYVRQLEEIGLLREITGQARNRVYRADRVLRVEIEEPLPRVAYYARASEEHVHRLDRLVDVREALQQATSDVTWSESDRTAVRAELQAAVDAEWAALTTAQARVEQAQRSALKARAAELLAQAALVELALGQQPDLFAEGAYPAAFDLAAVVGLRRHKYPWAPLLVMAQGHLAAPRPTDRFYARIQNESAEQLKRRFEGLEQRAKRLVQELAEPGHRQTQPRAR